MPVSHKKSSTKKPAAVAAKPAGRGRGRPPDALTADYNKARAQKTYWQAQLSEQEYLKNAGDLLDREQFETAQARVWAKVAQTLRSLPDNLERAVGLTPAQAEEAERIIDALCKSVHHDLKREGGWTE